MARTKGPLFSLGARGKIADTLIYSVWKGIDYVKEFAKPANPNTAAQQTQRTYFSDAVDIWHNGNFTAADFAGWNLSARYASKPMSGFNKLVKDNVDVRVAGDTWLEIHTVSASDSGADVDIIGTISILTGDTTKLDWGTSPTSLINEESVTNTTGDLTVTITAPGAGVKLYYKFRSTATGKAGNSGIYTHTHA